MRDGQQILLPLKLGFQLRGMPVLGERVKIERTETATFSETWEQPWGEKRLIENKYDELTVHFLETGDPGRTFSVVFRAFNDGVGFRYIIPAQAGIDSFLIDDELTEFSLPANDSAWWIPAYRDRFYESLYRFTPVSNMDTVHTPLTIKTGNGQWLAIHEANLTDYASMNLYCKDTSTLKCDLTPWSTGEKVRARAPLMSPWRTIIIAEKPGELITSTLMLNLNDPAVTKDISWIKPGRYVGIWWGMHQNKYTWSQGPKHGATTANAMRYIDFAAANHFSGVLVEGWNQGWDGDWTINGHLFSFTKPYPDFDIQKVTTYAAAKGVKLIGHHETGGATINYEQQMEEAFKFYNSLGVDVVKTGYVSSLLDGKERHGSQYGVRHYRKVIETALKYHIIIDNHEPVISTGLQRTYPNFMTSEGVRGQEWDAWSADGGNPPEHTTIIPFTRGLAGPMDFTPGTFNFTNPVLPQTRVQTTLAKQLALYIVIYSPLQMASDLPENYTNKEAFGFITSVPVDWEETRVLDAQIGDYIITARKDRNSDAWYLGAITDEHPRTLSVDLSFLGLAPEYTACIWADGEKADWEKNPAEITYYEKNVQPTDHLLINLAAGGGQAIRFSAIKKQ
ncbi:MAG: glycoside hydrolase family 97 protein [Bacteroidales bacterium]